MDRRLFLCTCVSALVTCECSFARRAYAKLAPHGCRAAIANEHFRPEIRQSSGVSYLDNLFRAGCQGAIKTFGVRPGTAFYDDAASLNALALPEALLPGSPDGTVLMGLNLFSLEFKRTDTFPLKPPPGDLGANWGVAPIVILAHEFGHIMQYKAGLTPAGPWQMEPHADFMAGWFLGRHFRDFPTSGTGDQEVTPGRMLEAAARSMFEKGDTAFNDPSHHGQPEFRSAMVQAGYDSSVLDPKAAFEKGRKLANLR